MTPDEGAPTIIPTVVPGRADPAANLQERFEALQNRVTRFSVVEQELINTRDRLDREVERFARLHAFNARVIKARQESDFAMAVAEAMVDVFELEFGAIWLRDPAGPGAPRLAGISGLALGEIQAGAIAGWLVDTLDLHVHPRVFDLLDIVPVRPVLPARQLVGMCCRDPQGRPTAYLLGGIMEENADFHDPLKEEHVGALEVLAQQVAAQLENRRGQAIIAEQVRRIEDSEERLALALEGSRVGLWDWDIANDKVHFSATSLGMVGLAAGALGTIDQWVERVHPEDRGWREAAVADHLAGKTPRYSVVCRVRHVDGHYLWVQSRGRVLRDGEGRAYRMVGTHFDVSAQKELERRLREAEESQRQAREQAESASHAKSDFLASMSHELRTPLNGVVGAVDLLRTTVLAPSQRELVDAASDSAHTLLHLIGDILDFSKIEAGKLAVERVPFSVGGVARNVVEGFRLRASAKGLDLRLELCPELPALTLGDPVRLTQVLNNLIANAIKFTTQGHVAVEVRCLASREGVAGAEFLVSDSGIGIPENVLPRLFAAFTQADDSVSRRFGGTGLGLAISQRLVDLMGGVIGVESQRGRGSVFHFWVPLPEAPLPAAPDSTTPGRALNAGTRWSGRALVVEDTPVNLRITVGMAHRLGLEADAATNGLEALERFDAGRHDVVLMDCNMPEMDGFEASREIRRREGELGVAADAGVWIIALTANALAGDRERCLAAGMNDYLSKPLTIAQFAAALGRSPLPLKSLG